jgi:methionine-S-sulfoxide reductase
LQADVSGAPRRCSSSWTACSRWKAAISAASVENPDYKSVCSGTTGHAEAIRIGFDADVIGYSDLLDIHFATHDPTQLNRQGNDIGTQYRSAIFPLDDEQRAEAEAAIVRAQPIGQRPSSQRSKGLRHGIRRRIIIRIIGTAKGSVIPIALP